VLAGEPVDLLETLCQRLADVCLADPLVEAVEITVHKPQAELGVPFDDVAVSIRRQKDPSLPTPRKLAVGPGDGPTSR
jgi:dihydroneopterin aldolase